MKKIFTICLAAAMLSSCGLYKSYQRPSEVKTDGIYGDAQSDTDKSMGDIKWREFFTDPNLQELIEKGLTQNSDMLNADLKIQEVEYALKCAKLAYIPNIYFNPSGNVSKLYDPYGRTDYKSSNANWTYNFPVSMNWQIGSIGNLRNSKKKAEITCEQLTNAKQAIQAALVSNIASLYYNLCMLDEQLAITCQTRDNWSKYLSMQKQLMQAGQSNLAAVSSIEATYHSICTGVESLESNIRYMENTMGTILGETGSKVKRASLSSFHAPNIISTGAPISLLSRRPDVKAAELALASAFYSKNIAKSSFYPSLTITGNGQYTNSAGAIVNPGVMIGTLLANIAQPIFQNGRLRAQYKISKNEMEIAQNDFQQAVIAAGNEVNTAMVAVHDAEAQRDLYAKQVASLETALSATEKLYATTSSNYLNVITAQNSLLQAQMSQISNRMEAINATIDLYQALGGGTE